MANTQTVTPGDYLYEILTHACGQWDAREVERAGGVQLYRGGDTLCRVHSGSLEAARTVRRVRHDGRGQLEKDRPAERH